MGYRQRDWARRKRRELVRLLGGLCSSCGTRGSARNGLEMDCRDPQGDRHHRQEWSARISFYYQQHRDGNLQLLCKRCHGRKSGGEGLARLASSDTNASHD